MQKQPAEVRVGVGNFSVGLAASVSTDCIVDHRIRDFHTLCVFVGDTHLFTDFLALFIRCFVCVNVCFALACAELFMLPVSATSFRQSIKQDAPLRIAVCVILRPMPRPLFRVTYLTVSPVIFVLGV